MQFLHLIKLNKKSPVFISLSLAMLFSVNSHLSFADDMPQWQHNQISNKASLRGSAIKQNSLWVTGSKNSVFVSTDQGKTWQDKSVKATVITDFRDIEVFDQNTAIVMGVGSGAQSMLYKTKDGGDSWKLLYQNTDPQGFFDSIAFWDNQSGLLVGDPVDGFYVMKKTNDGGKTWRRIGKDKLPQIEDKEAAFAASGNTLIVGKGGKAWLTTGGNAASVYHSNDFGESWQRQSVPLFTKADTAGGYGLGLNAMQQLFVVGGDYQQRPKAYNNMATYINGQWQAVDAGQHGLRTALTCQGNICIATGKTSSDISNDGGKSWQVFPNEKAAIDDKGFYTLASENMVFLAAGAEGKVGVLSLK